MKTGLYSFFTGLALLASIHLDAAQNAQFFRIAGPAYTKITNLTVSAFYMDVNLGELWPMAGGL
jgi:hypothetical protein